MTKYLSQISLIPFLLISVGCTLEADPGTVSFKSDVMPILKENCLTCHQKDGMGYLASGFSVESYENIMRGTKYGPVIQPGQSLASTLKVLLEHKADSKINMPKNAPKLSDDKIRMISQWIDQGAQNI